jgi:hypothetical protein
LFAAPTIATIKRRRFGDDRLVEHQDDRPLSCKKPAFKPPLACRQWRARNAN